MRSWTSRALRTEHRGQRSEAPPLAPRHALRAAGGWLLLPLPDAQLQEMQQHQLATPRMPIFSEPQIAEALDQEARQQDRTGQPPPEKLSCGEVVNYTAEAWRDEKNQRGHQKDRGVLGNCVVKILKFSVCYSALKSYKVSWVGRDCFSQR